MRVERENLRWIYEASQDLGLDMKSQNDAQDLGHHANLKGAVFRRPAFREKWYGGIAWFASAGLLYSYFPFACGLLGWNTSTFALYGALLGGLVSIHERNLVNCIQVLKEGDHHGWVQFDVSTSPFTQRRFVAKPDDCQAIASMKATQGEEDPLLNTIIARNAVDPASGETLGDQVVALPKDASLDYNTYDWLFAFKSDKWNDVDHEFNDLVMDQFARKAATGGISALAAFGRQTSSFRESDGDTLDELIDAGDSQITQNLVAMKEFYGQQAIDRMSPGEFYNAFKEFTAEKGNLA